MHIEKTFQCDILIIIFFQGPGHPSNRTNIIGFLDLSIHIFFKACFLNFYFLTIKEENIFGQAFPKYVYKVHEYVCHQVDLNETTALAQHWAPG